MSKSLRLLCVTLVVGLVCALGPVGTAAAASVASQTISTNATDKIRCASRVTLSGTSMESRIRCYYDNAYSGWIAAYGGTDLTATSSVTPYFLLAPKLNTGCTTQSTTLYEFGPQSASLSTSGLAIPSSGVQITAVATGAACTTANLGTYAWSFRVFVSGVQKVPACSTTTSSYCVVTEAAGWPTYPADWFPSGSSAIPAAPALTCAFSAIQQLDTNKVRVRVTPSWSFTPVGGVTWSASNVADAAVTKTVAVGYIDFFTTALPTDGVFYLTATATFATDAYAPSFVSCTRYVNLEDTTLTTPPDNSPEDTSYGCPSGWGLINPANLGKLARCLFVPRSTFMSDAFPAVDGLDGSFGTDTTGMTAGDHSFFAPVKELVHVSALLYEIVSVDDGEIGTCHVSLQTADFGGTFTGGGSHSTVTDGLDDALEFSICPDSGTQWIVRRIRDLSRIGAAWAFMRWFLRIARTQQATPGADAA